MDNSSERYVETLRSCGCLGNCEEVIIVKKMKEEEKEEVGGSKGRSSIIH